MKSTGRAIALLAGLFLAAPAWAGGELALEFTPACYKPGDTVTATLSMKNLTTPAAGFQAFLLYDSSKLTFTGWTYTDDPFRSQLLDTLSAVKPSTGHLQFAAGIDQNHPPVQSSTTVDSLLVTITFTAVSTGGNDTACGLTGELTFDTAHAPDSALTDDNGDAITPLALTNAGALSIVETNPTFVDCPGNTTVECDAVPTAATVTATAACGTATVHYDGEVRTNGSCPNNYTLTRTWTATDCAHNTATCTQVITVQDTTAPVATTAPGAGNATLECSNTAGIAAALAFVPSFSDNCTASVSAMLASDDTTPGSCANAYVRVRTWTASDGCGHTSLAYTQTITVQDTTAPVATTAPGAGDATLECSNAAGIAAALAFVPSFSDNCTASVSAVLASDNTTPGSCANAYVRVRTWTSSDGCGNTSLVYTQTITVHDTTGPVIDTHPSATVNVQCSSDVPAADDNSVTAHDACGGLVTVTHVDSAHTNLGCANHYSFTRTYTATDVCGNPTDFVQTITVNDTTPPVITQPGNISVDADAGHCNASATSVNVTPPTVSDNCDTGLVASGSRSDLLALSDPYPQGTTTITWSAADGCGNPAVQKTQTVTVSAFNQLKVSVQLASVHAPTLGPALTLHRCITFELFSCPSTTPTIVKDVLTFFSPDASTDAVATNAIVLVPCGNYSCITARDALHTLRRTNNYDFGVVGTQYVATFTNTHSLLGGNLNDDAYVDILDFGTYAGQYNHGYTDPNPLDGGGPGDTDCSTPRPHADISGNGVAFTEDFTFISVNFLKLSEANCCSSPGPLMAISSVSVADLKAQGKADLALGDVNGDGVLDAKDITAWMQGARPGQPLPPPPTRKR